MILPTKYNWDALPEKELNKIWAQSDLNCEICNLRLELIEQLIIQCLFTITTISHASCNLTS